MDDNENYWGGLWKYEAEKKCIVVIYTVNMGRYAIYAIIGRFRRDVKM